MDWFSVVLIFLFVVLPIIQQVIEAAKKKEEPQLDADGIEGVEPLPPIESGRRREQPDETAWSDDWLPWPGADSEEADAGQRSVEVATVERTLPSVPDVRRAVVDRLAQRKAVEKRKQAPPIRVQPAVRPRPQRLKGILRALDRPDDVQRAIVLGDILAPPVSMRSGEPGTRGD